MSRDQFAGLVKTHALQVAILILTAGIAFGVLRKQVEEAASRAELKALEAKLTAADQANKDSISHILQRVDERTARIERYICRKQPDGLGC